MEEYLKPISKQCTQKILDQMNSSSFGVIKDTYYICIFTKIKNKNMNVSVPVMITNYQIIHYKASNKYLNIYINNELNVIELGKEKYFNKDYDFAVIQIKENNKIKFLEVDDNINEKEVDNYYNKESIYIINYNNKNDISVEYSIINNINDSEIFYSKYFKNNGNILPIFNLSNNKLIGIQINNSNSKYYYKGLLFNFVIKDFIKKIKNSKNDIYECKKIDILMKINKNDINKDIYFLDKENKNSLFDELNNNKIELYINNIKNEYKKYFKLNKEGEYEIKLKFNYNLINCDYMFANCENIIKINFISFNTKYVKSMKYMFHRCINLKYINNLLIFDTRNVIDMSDMFSFCNNLNNLDLSSFNIKNVKNMSYMFYHCYNLKNLQLFSLNTQNNIDMDYIFDMCNKLKIEPFKLKINKNNKNMNKYRNEIDILIKVKIDDINKKIYFLDNYVEYIKNIFIKHSHDGLKELNNSNTKLYINNIRYEYQKYFIPKVEGNYNIKLIFNLFLTDCSYMFADCNNILQINFIHFNTKYIRRMHKMFYGCWNLNNLDLSSFDTKNVTDMSSMFYGCKNLTDIALSSFDTKNVSNMSEMFYCCNNLNNLDLSSFDTKKVSNMSYMFYYCENLNNLDLSSFDTKNVIDMCWMFSCCENLNNLDLSSFDTKNVTNIKSIFYDCPVGVYESNKSKFERFNKKELI